MLTNRNTETGVLGVLVVDDNADSAEVMAELLRVLGHEAAVAVHPHDALELAGRSTFDLATPDGDAIPIEERGRNEMATLAGRVLVPPGVPVRHPAFDVTPAELVTAIVSEAGIARPPYAESLAEQLERDSERAAG